MTTSKLRSQSMDSSKDVEGNIEALSTASLIADAEAEEGVDKGSPREEKFQLYPDENTAERLFNGIKYKDLPFISIKCTHNNTRLWARKDDADQTLLQYLSPRMLGFLHAKKRTAVAAQAAGLAMGQKLRLLNVRTVKVQIGGFNAGRIAVLKGLTQSGLNIVSLSDVTVVHFDWPKRAKKPKRKN